MVSLLVFLRGWYAVIFNGLELWLKNSLRKNTSNIGFLAKFACLASRTTLLHFLEAVCLNLLYPTTNAILPNATKITSQTRAIIRALRHPSACLLGKISVWTHSSLGPQRDWITRFFVWSLCANVRIDLKPMHVSPKQIVTKGRRQSSWSQRQKIQLHSKLLYS